MEPNSSGAAVPMAIKSPQEEAHCTHNSAQVRTMMRIIVPLSLSGTLATELCVRTMMKHFWLSLYRKGRSIAGHSHAPL